MDSKLTVDLKSILIAGLVLLGLVLAYLVGTADDDPATQAVAAEDTAEKPRALEMTGTGKVSVVPDQLAFSLGVTVKRTLAKTAWDDSSRIMKRILAELEAFGVKAEDAQTTGMSIDPDYQYYSYQPPQIVGYRVSQRARVTVDDLREAGEAISAAVEVGGRAVRISGIALQVSDRQEAMQEARDEAVAEATAKAEQYADATGQALGDVLSLREVQQRSRESYPYFNSRFSRASLYDVAAELAAVPIRAGEEDLSITVRIVWTFE